MSTLERAISIAAEAHAGQSDKNGAPYILHPLRVMMRAESDDARIVAVLHDLVEDTPWTLADLAEAGFEESVLHAIDDNLDPARVAALSEEHRSLVERYRRARAILIGET